MANIRLRSKFLLSLVVITAALTAATLLVVRYSVQKQVREGLQEDLRNSVYTYRTFERQRQDTLTRSSRLIADLPIVRALMTTRDAATIQDGSADVWRLTGSDLLVLAGTSGDVLGLQSDASDVPRDTAQALLAGSLRKSAARDWWFGDGHLYEIWIQPVYFGAPSDNAIIGYLVLGHDINTAAAKDFGAIASSEVAFAYGGNLIASTFPPARESEVARRIQENSRRATGGPEEVQIGDERYLETTVPLSSDANSPVSLSILKSLDQATSFLAQLNRVLLAMGLVSVLAGSLLVFVISRTFTRPLDHLVGAVRALAQGNFNYPIESAGGDEVAEVTSAFTGMRLTLEQNQTEQKKLEERLRQAHKMEAVGRLAGGVAHDFNNLLTIINGHSDILLERVGAVEAQRHNVEQIQRAAARAVSMTRQLLAFSRMQVLQPRILDLNVVVSEMGKMLPRLIGEHIEYSFVPGVGLAPVKADPGQIEQVILNLVVNSRDAMPNGGKITAKTQNVVVDESVAASRPPMTAGHYVLLAVSDTGHGIDEKTKAHIFEPFFTTKGVGKGTGLGLATVYGVVKQSGGFIWVESAIGQGTTFEIYLPQANEKVTASEAVVKPSLVRGTETVLVVEDELGVRELACEFLARSGYTVLQAKDGVDALETAARHSGVIHLMLSDMVMPRMGGAELAKQLHALRPDMKIVFMSGYSEYSGGDPSASSPFPVIQKPFSPPSLVSKIHELLAAKPADRPSEVTTR